MNTKKIFLIICISGVVLFALLWFIFWRDHDIKNYPSSGETIIAFGDSLVEGVGSTKTHDFVSLLSERLAVPIINAGHSGDTTEAALLRIDQDVLSKNPKVVLVLLGGNDFLRRVPKREMLSNLERIIGMIQARGAVVILLGVRGGLITDTYESDMEDLAQKTHAAYVSNVLEDLLGRPRYMYDSIHPNDAGYALIADRVLPVLSKLIH